MSESDVVEASHQAMKQPSSKKQIQGMMAIQDPAKNRNVSIAIVAISRILGLYNNLMWCL